MITITLTDGTVLRNLSLNGDNFIADYEIDPDIFVDNLTNVEINNDDYITVHEQMKLVQVTTYGDEYWFVIQDLTDRELKDLAMEAKIEYIAMMTDVDIDI